MKYLLSNEQLLLLGSLLHYDQVIGVEDTLEGIAAEDLVKEWKRCQDELIDQKLLYYTVHNTVSINKSFLSVLDNIFNPDIVFMIGEVSREIEITYFYIKGNRATCMQNNGMCQIEAFEEMEQFLLRFSECVGVSATLDKEFIIERKSIDEISEMIPSDSGKIIQCIKMVGDCNLQHMSMRTFSEEGDDYLIKYNSAEQEDEVILYKGSRQMIIRELFNFGQMTY